MNKSFSLSKFIYYIIVKKDSGSIERFAQLPQY